MTSGTIGAAAATGATMPTGPRTDPRYSAATPTSLARPGRDRGEQVTGIRRRRAERGEQHQRRGLRTEQCHEQAARAVPAPEEVGDAPSRGRHERQQRGGHRRVGTPAVSSTIAGTTTSPTRRSPRTDQLS
jgi:hypothetical protein